MDCRQSSTFLSNYFDGELPDAQRRDVEGHLRNCPACSQQLAFFSQLSEALRKLATPEIPQEMLWQRIVANLEESPRESQRLVKPIKRDHARTQWRWAVLSTAAIVLIAIGLSFGIVSTQPHHEELQRYATLFETKPTVAQQYLAEQFSGQTVSADEAIRLVGYRPKNVQPPPSGFVCDELVILNVPCCKCVQAIWSRPDRSQIAVFEHQSQMDDWFSHDPSVRIKCAGIECRVTQFDGQLAATWRVGRRVITVIGVKDTDELATLVRTLS